MNFAKFLRTPFFTVCLWWLLLNREESNVFCIIRFVEQIWTGSNFHINLMRFKPIKLKKLLTYETQLLNLLCQKQPPREDGCSPVNLLHIFRTPFPGNISWWLLLLCPFNTKEGCFNKFLKNAFSNQNQKK